MKFSLDGRVAVVTGGGQGVGLAIAHALAESGARAVVVNDYYQERADAVAETLRARGYEAVGMQADVTDHAQVQLLMESVIEKFGDLHILVNNAGNAGTSPITAELPKFSETSPGEWGKWMGTNFHGVLNCCHAAAPYLMRHKKGRVITIVSDAGRVGEAGYAVYSGAKAGAAGFMRAFAKELGKSMATANCISLASIETAGLASRNADSEYVKRKLSRYVIRRLGQPEDVVGAVVFLASDAASWVTGQTLAVNGGYSFNM